MFTLAGIDPGSFISEADALTTAARAERFIFVIFLLHRKMPP
jgi:hypothetical protein